MKKIIMLVTFFSVVQSYGASDITLQAGDYNFVLSTTGISLDDPRLEEINVGPTLECSSTSIVAPIAAMSDDIYDWRGLQTDAWEIVTVRDVANQRLEVKAHLKESVTLESSDRHLLDVCKFGISASFKIRNVPAQNTQYANYLVSASGDATEKLKALLADSRLALDIRLNAKQSRQSNGTPGEWHTCEMQIYKKNDKGRPFKEAKNSVYYCPWR